MAGWRDGAGCGGAARRLQSRHDRACRPAVRGRAAGGNRPAGSARRVVGERPVRIAGLRGGHRSGGAPGSGCRPDGGRRTCEGDRGRVAHGRGQRRHCGADAGGRLQRRPRGGSGAGRRRRRRGCARRKRLERAHARGGVQPESRYGTSPAPRRSPRARERHDRVDTVSLRPPASRRVGPGPGAAAPRQIAGGVYSRRRDRAHARGRLRRESRRGAGIDRGWRGRAARRRRRQYPAAVRRLVQPERCRASGAAGSGRRGRRCRPPRAHRSARCCLPQPESRGGAAVARLRRRVDRTRRRGPDRAHGRRPQPRRRRGKPASGRGSRPARAQRPRSDTPDAGGREQPQRARRCCTCS